MLRGDAVRPQILKESDIIVSDLPIGYYPDDQVASRYEVAASDKQYLRSPFIDGTIA